MEFQPIFRRYNRYNRITFAQDALCRKGKRKKEQLWVTLESVAAPLDAPGLGRGK